MSGEYIVSANIGTKQKMVENEVFIVKGGYSCNAGYVVWAYVARDTGKAPHYASREYDKYICRIGERLFDPQMKLGEKYAHELFTACKKYINDNGLYCNMIITMRTD